MLDVPTQVSKTERLNIVPLSPGQRSTDDDRRHLEGSDGMTLSELYRKDCGGALAICRHKSRHITATPFAMDTLV